MTDIEQHVINQVKKRRKKLNISQAELAAKMGMSLGFIGNIESPNYRAKYKIDHLNTLAQILHCSPQVFLPKKPFV